MHTTKFSLKQQTSYGISAFLLMAPLTLCFSAVSGQGLLPALLCIVVCSAFSMSCEKSVAAPHPLFTVPFLYVCLGASFISACFAVSTATCLFILFKNKISKMHIPDYVLAGSALGLCLGATILLTNSYFGIGAYGSTPLDMLKSYRSLGFHPHFMGLLTGTITLFTMITYPFKFKKLNKIIPAPFITIAIPYILNLFLNPERSTTAINEAVSLAPLRDFSIQQYLSDYNHSQIPFVLKAAIVFLFIFLCIEKTTNSSARANACNILSAFPVAQHSARGFGVAAAVIVVVLSVLLFVLCPDMLSRIPLHSAGSMLIVFAWQSLPYKKIANTFKATSKRIESILCFMISAVAFVVADAFTAVILCALICVISTGRRELK